MHAEIMVSSAKTQSCRGLSLLRSALSKTIALHSLPTAWVWPNFFLPSSSIFSLFFMHGVCHHSESDFDL